jgi:hypothetical protein
MHVVTRTSYIRANKARQGSVKASETVRLVGIYQYVNRGVRDNAARLFATDLTEFKRWTTPAVKVRYALHNRHFAVHDIPKVAQYTHDSLEPQICLTAITLSTCSQSFTPAIAGSCNWRDRLLRCASPPLPDSQAVTHTPTGFFYQKFSLSIKRCTYTRKTNRLVHPAPGRSHCHTVSATQQPQVGKQSDHTQIRSVRHSKVAQTDVLWQHGYILASATPALLLLSTGAIEAGYRANCPNRRSISRMFTA